MLLRTAMNVNVHVGFLVGKVMLRQVLHGVLRFHPLVSLCPCSVLILHLPQTTYNPLNWILGIFLVTKPSYFWADIRSRICPKKKTWIEFCGPKSRRKAILNEMVCNGKWGDMDWTCVRRSRYSEDANESWRMWISPTEGDSKYAFHQHRSPSSL